jgi:predicted HAD superfamily Cof-like phosphohydrolase
MVNVFADQEKFMRACDQTVGEVNYPQKQLYIKLIEEEFNELKSAESTVEELDALIDILVVTVGAIHSAGFDGVGAWNEVMRSNFAKINPDTGKVNKRSDGKVLKPVGWQPACLNNFIKID